jgi:hypothetical protein
MNPLVNALDYAARGWPVFPLRPPANTPYTAHGFHDATTDTEQIHAWWFDHGDANVGIRTGIAFDVLDIDHDDYCTGVADLPDCDTDGGPVVRTGRGRFHLYFKPTGLGRRIKFSAHCDWLGTGGYVVAPPSTHRAGGRYEWFAPYTLPLTAPPPVLVTAVNPPRPPHTPVAPYTPSSGNWTPSGLIAKVATALEGQRNDVLNWAALQVGGDVHAGKATQNEAITALDQLAFAASRAGLGDNEIKATIRSGYQAGLAGRP